MRTPLLVIVLIVYVIVAFAHPQWLGPVLQDEPATSSSNVVVEPAPAPAPGDPAVEPAPVAPAEVTTPKVAKDESRMFSLRLPSGQKWHAHFSDLLLLFAAVMLYFELFKSTRTDTNAIVEHILSLMVFVIFLVLFLTVKPCGTSTFLLATLMSLIDVIAGFTITISTARRDLVLGPAGGAGL